MSAVFRSTPIESLAGGSEFGRVHFAKARIGTERCSNAHHETVGRIDSEECIADEQREIPSGHLTNPEEIAGTVAFFICDEAAFIIGQSIAVNGGALVVGA
ncbi:SDR family oxidoreductase [Burkholderia humptydooensis]|uniref:SDR family oxidoreductase n=2 Tax=Burkholderia humptydooensis TaxID=430531 RepID=A0A7U4SSY9_9BURK|nr:MULTISPECIES: SDR family oxidoreductase [Burkholderia]AJY43694.1 hypothetical protein BW21_2650 [Burkholderia sp. 2002721687]ALX43142.1 hypothetical protein AQ610_12515 [Burkholderia humptydooensis]EIP84758.1 hypothetical protein A33K_18613 [Burkholderia humptydooensis MSMB43]QPS44943.1 SDR family oxidoreductase [Burkholderia humptydooensis]